MVSFLYQYKGLVDEQTHHFHDSHKVWSLRVYACSWTKFICLRCLLSFLMLLNYTSIRKINVVGVFPLIFSITFCVMVLDYLLIIVHVYNAPENASCMDTYERVGNVVLCIAYTCLFSWSRPNVPNNSMEYKNVYSRHTHRDSQTKCTQKTKIE